MILWQKFANETILLKELLETYLEMRLFLQELGYTEKQLSRVHSAPGKLWALRHKIDTLQDRLYAEIDNFGFDIKWTDFAEWIRPKYKNIDELTPLQDGNNERTDNWDEDIE